MQPFDMFEYKTFMPQLKWRLTGGRFWTITSENALGHLSTAYKFTDSKDALAVALKISGSNGNIYPDDFAFSNGEKLI